MHLLPIQTQTSPFTGIDCENGSALHDLWAGMLILILLYGSLKSLRTKAAKRKKH